MEIIIKKLEEDVIATPDNYSHLSPLNQDNHFPMWILGEGTKDSKNAQAPQNYRIEYDGIQDRLNGACHRDETVLISQRIIPTTIRLTTI